MPVTSAPYSRNEFAPPPARGRAGGFSLAVLAHLALLAALTWGVRWKQDTDTPAVEAEIWSATPRQAAPQAVQTPPPPPIPAPPPPPAPEPAPAPPPPPPPPPAPQPDTRDADIALQKQKQEIAREKQRQQQLEQAREKKLKEQQEAREEAAREKAAEAKKLADKQARAEKQALLDKQEKAAEKQAQLDKQKQLEKQKQLDKQKQAAEDKQKQAAEDKRKDQAEAKVREDLRKQQMARMAGLAGATGGATATGSDLRSSGPSGSYGGKVAAKVRPNITFTEDTPGNPRAEVEVRAAPDGTIVGKKLVKSSGNPAWDDAVLKAIDKTESLPKDIDGRVPPSMVISFRPRD